MLVPVEIVLAVAHDVAPGRAGWVLALVIGTVAGLLVYLLAHLLLRSVESLAPVEPAPHGSGHAPGWVVMTVAGSGALNHTSGPAGIVAATLAGGTLIGPLVVLRPWLAAMVVAACALGVCVWRVPETAAFLTITITPLVAGIDRGRLIPVLRPNEALVAALAGILVVRALVQLRPGQRWRLRLSRLEVALVLMAVANSFLPLALMLLRGRPVEADDISYAMVLWKYLGVYALVRASVHTDRAVRWCLWGSVFSASVVAVIGILQALDVLGIRHLLEGYYAPFGYTGALAQPRGGSTLALPAAAADLLILNLVIVTGLWWKDQRRPLPLAAFGSLFVFGVLAAAEFSSTLGLVVAMLCVALALHRFRLLAYAPLAIAPAIALLWPVINHRLIGFQGAAGLPVSWTTRLSNLQNYFGRLFSGWNPLLGVRPAARVVVEVQGTGFVWIESGYTWLFWGGGIPLAPGLRWFVVCRPSAGRCGRGSRPRGGDRTARESRRPPRSSGVVVVTVLMLFDPHLTYRGAARPACSRCWPSTAVRPSTGVAATPEHVFERTGERS